MKGKYVTKRDADSKAFSTKFTRDIFVLKTKIAHFEDKIKITEIDKQKLKKLEKEKIAKLEEEKKNIEISIDNNLNELNSRKEKIYNIQKPLLENFRKSLQKLTQSYEESTNKINQMLNGESGNKKNVLQSEGEATKREYDQANAEFNALKEEAQEKLKEMNQLKTEYPKEYQYFQEKIKLFKKINDLKEENINISKQIKNLQKNISDDDKIKNEKNSIQQKITTEKERNKNKIEELKSGIALEQLENDLKKHNSDIFSWSYIKEIMVQYYGEKYYNEKSDEFIYNLRNMWTNRINYIFNEEYLRTKRAKESRLETVMNRLSELEINNKNESEEAAKLKEESENLKEELTIDENDFNKVYSLFNDVILLLNQIKDENKDNDDLFSNHFIQAIININPDYSTNMKEYAKKNFDRLINLYINELIEHSKSKKNLIMRNKKCDEFIEEKNTENLLLEDKIKTNNEKMIELTNKKNENLKEIEKIKNLIDVKTTEMKKYLNELCEEAFKNYQEQNSDTLKNFNKIYGKKILTKANKVQKEKIYEDRINQHLKMKDLMEGLSNYIKEYHEKNKLLSEKITKLSEKYQEIMDQVDEIELSGGDSKEKEEERRKEIKNEIDKKVKEQSIKLKNQKKKLEKQENIDYYIENLKKLNSQLKNVEVKKEKTFEQFALFFKQVQDEQNKLQDQSHKLKLQLLGYKEDEDENAFGSKVKMNTEEYNNNREEEKNEDDEHLKNLEKRELLKSKKSKNKLAVPETLDIFNLEQEDFGGDIEIPEIDMYNQKIKPLFEGTKVYKRFSEKAVKTEYEEYDPIKNKGILPEAYDYCLRKLYANIKERQFEFFTVEGLPKKEGVIPFNQIIGIRYSDNAKKIIKLKENNPLTGTKTDFIGKDNIPFSIMTKKNNWDIVCPEYTSYVAVKTMVDSILEESKQKNQSLFEIGKNEKMEMERISSRDNYNENFNENNNEGRNMNEEYYE